MHLRRFVFLCSLTVFGVVALQAQESPAPARPPGAPDTGLKDIERSWLNTIHGDGAQAPEGQAEESSPATRFRNPGEAAAQPGNDGQSAAAETTPELFADTGEEGPSFFSVVFRFLGMAALMILVLYAGLRLMRSRAGPLTGTGDLVQVVATVPLMQGRFLQIVDLAGQLLVLGVSDSGVTLVQQIDDARIGDRIRLWQAERARLPLPTGMLEQLTGVLKNSDFKFWHSEGRRDEQPGFKDWLSRYAPGSVPATEPGDTPTGDQEALSRLLNSQREKLSAMQRQPRSGR